MNGTVKNIVDGRGFGFIRGENGMEFFFHRTAVIPRNHFDSLTTGDRVVFNIEQSDKGPRAVDVRVDM